MAQPSGDICVNTLKKDWNPAKWHLLNIFEVIKCLLIVPFPESSLNEEAGKQFMEDYSLYCQTARVYTEIHARPAGEPANNSSEPAQIEEEKQQQPVDQDMIDTKS